MTSSPTASSRTPTIPIAGSCCSTSTSTATSRSASRSSTRPSPATASSYITNFRDVRLEAPDPSDRSAMTRHRRRVLFYRALLFKAGLTPPATLRPDHPRSLLGPSSPARWPSRTASRPRQPPATAPRPPSCKRPPSRGRRSYRWRRRSGTTSPMASPPSGSVRSPDYVQTSSSGSWADDDLRKVLEMFSYPNGSRLVGRVAAQHTPDTSTDYADDIYEHLVAGRLVIVDQSSGDPELNKASADRIMRRIFEGNQALFRAAAGAAGHPRLPRGGPQHPARRR